MNDPQATSRNTILSRLRANLREAPAPAPPADDHTVLISKSWPPVERLARLRVMMEAVHTEFLDGDPVNWPAQLRDWLAGAGVKRMLYGPASPVGQALARHPAWLDTDGPELVAYDQPVETFKDALFETMDAGLTGTRGAIADTGSLILWPDAEEPRLLSLVPHIHIALLSVSKIHDTLWQVIREQNWAQGMPTNALLISGPSKTADIEQTLAYGVHGPKRLLVILVP